MTVYDAIDEDIWNVVYHAKQAESDMEWALANPERANLSDSEKKIFERNLPIFKEFNARLRALSRIPL